MNADADVAAAAVYELRQEMGDSDQARGMYQWLIGSLCVLAPDAVMQAIEVWRKTR